MEAIETKPLDKIIDELAKEKGYPYIKLSVSEYREVLREAHKIKYCSKKKK